MGLFSKIFGTYSEKEVKRVMPIVAKINGLEPEISKLSDEELTGKTQEFKKRLNEGETLDDILPEAFADDLIFKFINVSHQLTFSL